MTSPDKEPIEKRRILGNSALLYIRTFITLAVTLYASRVILKNLGVEGYGIFNVVGGVALFFSFFNNALTLSTQRFITVAIGAGDTGRVREVFTTSIHCHALIALLILVMSETVGLWFLNTQINIPPAKMVQANIVYQACVAVCLLGVLNVPYTGAVVAYERMGFFAVVSVISSVMRLLVALGVGLMAGSRLPAFALLLFVVSLITFLMTRIYCRRHLDGCRIIRFNNHALYKEIMSFSGWNMLKMIANMGVAQGYNIIVNLFGGPLASAAMGLAAQVNSAANGFMTNVQTAFNPQITKQVSNQNIGHYTELVSLCTKSSVFMLLAFCLPLMVNMDYILHLWLGAYPPDTATLCRLAMVSVMVDCAIGPMSTAVMARGRIGVFQTVNSVLLLMAVPAAWFSLDNGMAIRYVIAVKIIAQVLIAVYSMVYMGRHLGISFRRLAIDIYGRTFGMMTVAAGVSYVVGRGMVRDPEVGSLQMLAVTTLVSWAALILGGVVIGADKADRQALAEQLRLRGVIKRWIKDSH